MAATLGESLVFSLLPPLLWLFNRLVSPTILDCLDRARPDEAVSWGKIRLDAKPVKVYGEASILFPLLVAQTFAKRKSR